MPQIHTMCLPIGADGGFAPGSGGSGKTQGQGLGPGGSGSTHSQDKTSVNSSETGLGQGKGLGQGASSIAAVVNSIVPGFVENPTQTDNNHVNGDGGGNGRAKLLQLGNSPYNATTTTTTNNNNNNNNNTPMTSSENITSNHNNQKGGGGGGGGLESYECEFLRSGYADLAESRLEVIAMSQPPYQCIFGYTPTIPPSPPLRPYQCAYGYTPTIHTSMYSPI